MEKSNLTFKQYLKENGINSDFPYINVHRGYKLHYEKLTGNKVEENNEVVHEVTTLQDMKQYIDENDPIRKEMRRKEGERDKSIEIWITSSYRQLRENEKNNYE